MYELVVTHQFQPVHKGCTVGTTKPFVFKFLSERQDLRFREFVPTPRKKQNEKKKNANRPVYLSATSCTSKKKPQPCGNAHHRKNYTKTNSSEWAPLSGPISGRLPIAQFRLIERFVEKCKRPPFTVESTKLAV